MSHLACIDFFFLDTCIGSIVICSMEDPNDLGANKLFLEQLTSHMKKMHPSPRVSEGIPNPHAYDYDDTHVLHKYDRYHGRHNTYDRHALNGYATSSCTCPTCIPSPKHVKDDRYVEKKHSKLHLVNNHWCDYGDEEHGLYWESIRLQKEKRRAQRKREKEMHKLLKLHKSKCKEEVRSEVEIPKREEHIDTFVVSKDEVDDTLCLSQPPRFDEEPLFSNVSSLTMTNSLPSVEVFPFNVCVDLSLEEVERNTSLAKKGIGFVLHISLPSLASLLRYTSIFSTSHTLNDLLVDSKSLVVHRFWIGNLGHLIIFYYNDCLSFMQIVNGHVIFVSLIWCVQNDINLLVNQDTCGHLEQHAPSLIENVCVTHALVPTCLVPNDDLLVQPF